MKFLLQVAAVLIAIGLSTSQAQDQNILCNFQQLNNTLPYVCAISGASIADDESLHIVIGGEHLPGLGNADVREVFISHSAIPFIPTQIFTTFPNLELFTIHTSELRRVQSRAFSFAQNLVTIVITENPELREIQANAINGASSLFELILADNGIETIHGDAFAGTSRLYAIDLFNNSISRLPFNVFNSVLSLGMIDLSFNQLETLDGRLLQNVTQMFILDVANNRINAVGRSFFDSFDLTYAFLIEFSENVCVNHFWIIGGGIDFDNVRTDMEQCFENFETQAQTISCNFHLVGNTYTCEIVGASLVDDESLHVVIEGEHLPAMSDADVLEVVILHSNVPFIPTQIFTTFPNLELFTAHDSGLTRVESHAFSSAINVNLVVITENPELREIEANAFQGATNLDILILADNQIETLHEEAFAATPHLQSITLFNNSLSQLPLNVFRFMTTLTYLDLSFNQLERLDGRLFENVTQMFILDLAGNRVNAVGRSFFDAFSMDHLFLIDFTDNVCVDHYWILGGSINIDNVRRDMEQCFLNFETPDPEVRTFILELRGSLILRDVNGTEIIRL